MKRALALTAEPARHPFRRSLRFLQIAPQPGEKWTDIGFFLASFLSGFIIFFGLIF